MKAEFFQAVCPLEIGDAVAIKMDKRAQAAATPLDALYLPKGATVLVGGADIKLATVTDIASVHYVKSGETQFIYELDGSGSYQPMKVTQPTPAIDELKKRCGKDSIWNR